MKPVFYHIVLNLYLLLNFLQAAQGQNAPVTSLSVVGNAIPGQQVTVQVTVTGFNNIGSVSLSMDYDFLSIQYVSAAINPELGNSGTFAVGDNDLGNGSHRVICGWYGSGTTLTDNTSIISITFSYTSGSSALIWYDNGASCAYTDFAGKFLIDTPSATYYKNGIISGVSTGIDGDTFQYGLSDLINVFPNPSPGNFNLKIVGTDFDGLEILVLSGNGTLLRNTEIKNNTGSGEYLIDTSNMPSGLYFIVINSAERRIIRKIIKL